MALVITLDFAPPDKEAWAAADAGKKREWFKLVADLMVTRLKARFLDGRDRFDRKFLKRINPRPDRANGPPLSPHNATSRCIKLMRSEFTDRLAKVFWDDDWGTILEYHQKGIRSRLGLRVRDAGGLSQKEKNFIYGEADQKWVRPALTAQAEVGAGAEALPQALDFSKIRWTKDPVSQTNKFQQFTVSIPALDSYLRADLGYFVGTGGSGPSARVGSYKVAVDQVRKAATTGGEIWSPRIGLTVDGGLTVSDGRHRLAALRDLGARTVVIAVRPNEVQKVKRLLGVPAMPAGGQRQRPRGTTSRPRPETDTRFGSFFR